MTDYTYSSRILVGDGVALYYYELQVFLLAAILQAKLDVVDGVTDSSVSDFRKPRIRSDALAFFVDGRFDTLLEIVGVGTRDMAEGVDEWIKRMGAWARNMMPRYPPPVTDEVAIMWGHEAGIFNTDMVWQKATEGLAPKKRARRLQVQHLDSGRDNLIKG